MCVGGGGWQGGRDTVASPRQTKMHSCVFPHSVMLPISVFSGIPSLSTSLPLSSGLSYTHTLNTHSHALSPIRGQQTPQPISLLLLLVNTLFRRRILLLFPAISWFLRLFLQWLILSLRAVLLRPRAPTFAHADKDAVRFVDQCLS